jgi:hypothetical protein
MDLWLWVRNRAFVSETNNDQLLGAAPLEQKLLFFREEGSNSHFVKSCTDVSTVCLHFEGDQLI